jgi:hypothetical protein
MVFLIKNKSSGLKHHAQSRTVSENFQTPFPWRVRRMTLAVRNHKQGAPVNRSEHGE